MPIDYFTAPFTELHFLSQCVIYLVKSIVILIIL